MGALHPKETLSGYLSEQLGRDVNCQRIATTSNRYSSFKVWVECNKDAALYKPELWPEGSVVKRYYEPRKVGVISTASPIPGMLIQLHFPTKLFAGWFI